MSKKSIFAMSDEEYNMHQEAKCRKRFRITTPTSEMSHDDLIDWLAQIAHDNGYWGWIRQELLKRLNGSGKGSGGR